MLILYGGRKIGQKEESTRRRAGVAGSCRSGMSDRSDGIDRSSMQE